MGTRGFESVVREVLAEAERSLLAEHDRLLEERWRSGETFWVGQLFTDDTEEGEPRNVQASPHDLQSPPGTAVSTRSPEALIHLLPEREHASEGVEFSGAEKKAGSRAASQNASSTSGTGSNAVAHLGMMNETDSNKGRSSVLSFADCVWNQSWDSAGGIERTSHTSRKSNSQKRPSLCLSRGITVQEVIELGGLGRQAGRTEPLWQRLQHSRTFQTSMGEAFISSVVVFNIVTIGISCDVGIGWIGWTILDTVFAVIFTVECAIKIYTLGCRSFLCGNDYFWNIFEAMLAAFALFEVGLTLMQASTDTRLSILRVVRLARLARVIRICRLEAFSDLMMMINGAVGGAKTLLWSIVLISLPLYAVSLLLRETLGASHHEWLQEQTLADDLDVVPINGSAATATGSASSDAFLAALLSASSGFDGHAASAVEDARAAQVAAEAFSSLPWALFNVFRCIVGQDCSTKEGKPIFVHVARAYGWGYGVVYCVTMVLMTFGLFNVIVAIYVENTVAAAKSNSIIMKQHRLKDSQLAAEHLHMMLEIICDIHEDLRAQGASGISSSGTSGSGRDGTQSMGILEENFEITPKFMDILKDDPRVLDILRALDINDADILDLFDTLDVDGSGSIDVAELIQGLMKLRGEASRSDVVGVRLVCRNIQEQLVDVHKEFTRFETSIKRIEEGFQELTSRRVGAEKPD